MRLPSHPFRRPRQDGVAPSIGPSIETVVRSKVNGAFQDVELDCAGKLGGWQPVGAAFEMTRFDLVRGDFQKQGACDNGRHEMKSAAPFALTLWGWGSAATNGFHTEHGAADDCAFDASDVPSRPFALLSMNGLRDPFIKIAALGRLGS